MNYFVSDYSQQWEFKTLTFIRLDSSMRGDRTYNQALRLKINKIQSIQNYACFSEDSNRLLLLH